MHAELREATNRERELAQQLSGIARAQFVWVSNEVERTLIVVPDFGIEGVAILIDGQENELWRTTAFYSRLWGAGDGMEANYHGVTVSIRASFNGTFFAAIILADGHAISSDNRMLFDEREAQREAKRLADSQGNDRSESPGEPNWEWA